MTLLGIDLGTTHCKAGLFDLDGTTLKVATRRMIRQRGVRDEAEFAYFDPEMLWTVVRLAIREVMGADHAPIQAIGISSMAESGLLIDRNTGEVRSPILPWFDTSAQPQANTIAVAAGAETFYRSSGLRVNYKTSLAKILWLRERNSGITDGAIWLSVADFIAYRLTGAFGTDYSLAGRTGAFDIATKKRNDALLRQFDLTPDLFPPAALAGTPVGTTITGDDGLAVGIPVAVSGHDHICASLGAGAVEEGVVFDSTGTAEVLTGAFPERTLTADDFASGLLSGCHVMPERGYWLGSLSTSGGAVEWLRGILNATIMSYDELIELAKTVRQTPTGILFYPYLLGSGAPDADPLASGAWIGLRHDHARADLAMAVLEGIAFEIELIRRAAEAMTDCPITGLTVAGGGTRNPLWLEVKADVSGIPIHVCGEPEAALLGAALSAGIGMGMYASIDDALSAIHQSAGTIIEPNAARHERYKAVFESKYLPLKSAVHKFGQVGEVLAEALTPSQKDLSL